mgnify:CR=1 FL=1
MTTPEPTTLREALEAIAAEHHADPDGGMGYRDGGYGHMDSVCVLCGTSDEYGIPWPCETHEHARAALAAPPAAPFYCLNAEGHSGRHSGWVDGEWSVTDTPDNPVLHMPESVAIEAEAHRKGFSEGLNIGLKRQITEVQFLERLMEVAQKCGRKPVAAAIIEARAALAEPQP